jgi:hypothetical protein
VRALEPTDRGRPARARPVLEPGWLRGGSDSSGLPLSLMCGRQAKGEARARRHRVARQFTAVLLRNAARDGQAEARPGASRTSAAPRTAGRRPAPSRIRGACVRTRCRASPTRVATEGSQSRRSYAPVRRTRRCSIRPARPAAICCRPAGSGRLRCLHAFTRLSEVPRSGVRELQLPAAAPSATRRPSGAPSGF